MQLNLHTAGSVAIKIKVFKLDVELKNLYFCGF